jgi:hypothetical protein
MSPEDLFPATKNDADKRPTAVSRAVWYSLVNCVAETNRFAVVVANTPGHVMIVGAAILVGSAVVVVVWCPVWAVLWGSLKARKERNLLRIIFTAFLVLHFRNSCVMKQIENYG